MLSRTLSPPRHSTTLLKLCCATNPVLRALQPVEDQFCRETVGLVHLISSGPTKSISCTKTDCAILSNTCQGGFAPGNPHTMGETRERLRCISADDTPDYDSAAASGKSQGWKDARSWRLQKERKKTKQKKSECGVRMGPVFNPSATSRWRALARKMAAPTGAPPRGGAG